MIQELNVNNFDQEINKDKPVVVEFYTTACSHCKKLAGALNKLSEEKGDDVSSENAILIRKHCYRADLISRSTDIAVYQKRRDKKQTGG